MRGGQSAQPRCVPLPERPGARNRREKASQLFVSRRDARPSRPVNRLTQMAADYCIGTANPDREGVLPK